jgi:hypothetical protein
VKGEARDCKTPAKINRGRVALQWEGLCNHRVEVEPNHNERSHPNLRRGGEDGSVNAPSRCIKTHLNVG